MTTKIPPSGSHGSSWRMGAEDKGSVRGCSCRMGTWWSLERSLNCCCLCGFFSVKRENCLFMTWIRILNSIILKALGRVTEKQTSTFYLFLQWNSMVTWHYHSKVNIYLLVLGSAQKYTYLPHPKWFAFSITKTKTTTHPTIPSLVHCIYFLTYSEMLKCTEQYLGLQEYNSQFTHLDNELKICDDKRKGGNFYF